MSRRTLGFLALATALLALAAWLGSRPRVAWPCESLRAVPPGAEGDRCQP